MVTNNARKSNWDTSLSANYDGGPVKFAKAYISASGLVAAFAGTPALPLWRCEHMKAALTVSLFRLYRVSGIRHARLDESPVGEPDGGGGRQRPIPTPCHDASGG
jgi:hypothetical protein